MCVCFSGWIGELRKIKDSWFVLKSKILMCVCRKYGLQSGFEKDLGFRILKVKNFNVCVKNIGWIVKKANDKLISLNIFSKSWIWNQEFECVCVFLVELENWEKLRILDFFQKAKFWCVCVANMGCKVDLRRT